MATSCITLRSAITVTCPALIPAPQKHPLQLSARRDSPAILDNPPYLYASQ
jgi:hypothetical protein